MGCVVVSSSIEGFRTPQHEIHRRPPDEAISLSDDVAAATLEDEAIRRRPQAAMFIELNAGSGTLTAAVVLTGVNAAAPDDPRSGGTDLTDRVQVAALWQSWVELYERGYHLVIH